MTPAIEQAIQDTVCSWRLGMGRAGDFARSMAATSASSGTSLGDALDGRFSTHWTRASHLIHSLADS